MATLFRLHSLLKQDLCLRHVRENTKRGKYNIYKLVDVEFLILTICQSEIFTYIVYTNVNQYQQVFYYFLIKTNPNIMGICVGFVFFTYSVYLNFTR